MSEGLLAVGERDVTAQTVDALQVLMAQNKRTIAMPRDLFMVAPDVAVWGVSPTDSMLPRSSREFYDKNLGPDPVGIASMSVHPITAAQPESHVFIRTTDDVSCNVDRKALAGITFIQTPSKENVDDVRKVNDSVHSLLTGMYKNIDTNRLYDIFGGKHRVGVRASDPLVQPVMYGYDDPTDGHFVTGAVSGRFTSITSYVDENGGQMARVSYDVIEGKGKISDWVPLSWLEFYPLASSRPEELIRYAAGRLALDPATLDSFNEKLQELNLGVTIDGPRIWYDLSVNTRGENVERISQLPIVLGTIATSGSTELASVFAPSLPYVYPRRPHLAVSRVMLLEETPWVVDDDSRLAAPLVTASALAVTRTIAGFGPINVVDLVSSSRE